jgi:cytochrome bd ubiquinol oxidase subunit I
VGIWVLASEASSNLLAAREMMAFTLGFHILLVPLGVALPAITLIANWRGVRKRDDVALLLARRWSKVMAVTFAVGAITGTVLSFELGLLWPGLMGKFGDVFGLGFNIEASAFFLEAILIAIYIYGWDRLSHRAHLWTGVPIPFVSMIGAASIVAANSWLNTPQGFTLGSDGLPKDIDVASALFTPAFPYEFAHMIIAAYLGAGFLVASVYAVGMLRGRNDRYHRLGFLIPFTVAAILTPVQLVVGDQITRMVIRDQPVKFAAIEGVQQSGNHEPEALFGYLPGNGQDDDASIEYAIKIPDLASFLTGGSADTEIKGLNTVKPDDRPPVNIVHLAFDVMVLTASALALLVLWFGFVWWRRRRLPKTRWFLRCAAVSGVALLVTIEAGWIVTEVGRQPWIVYNVLRTKDAVTDHGGIWISFALIVVVYLLVAVGLITALRVMARRWRDQDDFADSDVPYGPRGALRLGEDTAEPAPAGEKVGA